MKKQTTFLLLLFFSILVTSCKEKEVDIVEPEMESLKQGIRASAAIAYCASITASAFNGEELPSNVVFVEPTELVPVGMITIKLDKNSPLPFNGEVGDIVIAGIWKKNVGLISILFGDINVLEGTLKLYGMDKIPVGLFKSGMGVETYFEKGDMILGNGSDTIMNLNGVSDVLFSTKTDILLSTKPTDLILASSKNRWFVSIDQNNTSVNVYDDNIVINGGGKITEIASNTGGYMYHALINAKINIASCSLNLISGKGLIQNFKVGGASYLDLGHMTLNFTNSLCNGKALVDVSTGKYSSFNGKEISLGL